MLNKIPNNFLLPSAAFTLSRGKIKFWEPLGRRRPKIGDLAFGIVTNLGQHKTLENKSGRIHAIYKGTNIIVVFGNRYAPDYYEGIIPKNITGEVDLLARSGVIGLMLTRNAQAIDPTKVKIYGYVCDKKGKILNTRDYPLISPKKTIKKSPRSKMILVCGTSMNSGKSRAVFACCQTLSFYGHRVKVAKITGTASLKEILGASDAGARSIADFSYLGYPSTYLLKKQDVLDIFNKLDLKYANNPKNYWVVEFADGINQRETQMLLMADDVRKRIHKFIFCASDAFGAIGGIKILRQNFNLEPDLLSGICSSSPLHIKEIREFINKPVFNSHNPNMEELIKLL